MSVLFTATVQVAGSVPDAQAAFDAYRETKLPGADDAILWNMRPTGEAMTYLIEVESTDDEAEARQVFEDMVARTGPAENGIDFRGMERVQEVATPGL